MIVFLLVLLFKNGEGVKVDAVEESVKARFGSWATLSVTVDSDPHPTLEEISWYKGDLDNKISDARHSVGGQGTELNVALTRSSDYTTYTCRVTGGEGLCKSCTGCTGSCGNCCATISLSATEQSGANVQVTQTKALWTAGETLEAVFSELGIDYVVEQVTWYKGIYPLTTGGRYTITKVPLKFTIQSLDASDNGDYAVVYKTSRSGSITYGISEFAISVLGNPVVMVTPQSARVTESSDVTFTCTAQSSSSSPTYRWYKNGEEMSGKGGDKLSITDVVHEHAAEYKCTVSFTHTAQIYSAYNIAYLVINDDTVLEVLTPFLLADVSSQQAVLSFKVTSRVNEPVTEEMVTWYKDSVILGPGNGIAFASSRNNLIISNPTAEHEGHYRVMVQLTTVTLEGSMQLAVTSALPTIKFSSGTFVGRSGEQLIFTIEVGGNPFPDVSQIEWYLNNERLYQGGINVRFSDNYLQLYRSKLRKDEEGLVKVVVETSAGRTEETAEVLIIKQDDIHKTRSSENQLLGKSLKLSVLFYMVPLPVGQSVQWTRSSDILTDTAPRIEFYNSGQELLVKSVQLEDAGTYTITVNKPDGETVREELLVSVRTKTERLTFSTRPTDVTVEEGSTATISCDITGTPSPTISFQFVNDTKIPNSGRFYVTATSLEIWATEVSDTAKYKCQGNNGDETVSADFTLTVNRRIVIEAELAEVPATIGGSAHLTVYIQPTNARVTWTRQGVNFPESDGGHYDVQTDHNFVRNGAQYRRDILTISTVQSSDLGRYEATASYNEGKYVGFMEIQLTNGGSNVVTITAATGDSTVYQGQNVKFSCSVSSSVDQITITWTRNGQDVTQLEDSVKARYVLSSSKQELTVTTAVPDDKGLYVCTVSSYTGRDQASATLTVTPPIKITEYPTHRRLLVGSGATFLLSVTVASGDPASQIISWKLGGSAIKGDTTSISPNVPSSTGTSVYRVSASLPSWLSAGPQSDETNIYVTTYDVAKEAVIIQTPTDQTAILGSTVTFQCVAYGIPDPTIRWTNGSADMSSSYFTTKYTVRGVESQLVISNVKPHFQGDYRCKADNLKGSMQTKPVYLEIINPPSVRLVDSVYYGVLGKELLVDVQVEYQNTVTKSMCRWTRNGVVLQEEAGRIEFGSDGTTLKISSVESSSAGTYSFTIETEAGSATTSTTMEIIDSYILPSATIPPYHSEEVALRGSVYHLQCQVAGKPVPKVTWRTKDGATTLEFKDTGDELQYSVQPDSSLRIASVRNNDTGTWTCIAQSSPESVAQTAEAHLVLQVVEWLARPFVYPYHGHDTITVVSGDTLEANIEVMYRYQIRAHNIVWKRLAFGRTDWENAKDLNMVDPGYDNVVAFARDRRQLMVHGISGLYEGQYCAMVKTVAGEANTTIAVYVISRVSPQIRWDDTIAGSYYTVNGASDFVFNINVTGEPFPKEITWYKKTGQEYEGIRNGTIGNYFYLVGYYGDLYMGHPDKSSAGFYKIQVTPEKGGQDQMQEGSVELVVKDYYLGFQTAPYVGGIQKIGVAVTLTCLARGVPDPESVVWFRGITRLASSSSLHTIPAVSKEDKGDYYCVATNNYGTIYSPKVSLQVQYLDSDFSPITCYKEHKTTDGEISMEECTQTNLKEGNVFTLRCNSPDGWPYPKTTWFFNNDPIDDNTNGMDPSPNQYGDLLFPWADPKHSGKYTCQVTNDETSRNNYHQEIDVKVAPSDDTSVDNAKTAEWLIQPGDVTVAQHTPVTIACLVSSFPPPTYKWTLNGDILQPITGSREITFGGRLLTFALIDNVSNGNYVCISSTKDEADKRAEFKLQVATRPAFVNAPIFMVGYNGNETEIDLGTPSGHPVPTVVWTFNGEGVQLGDRINLIDTKTLRIDPTEKGDQGVWQATATNKAGSAQHAIYLKVEESLKFVESPASGSNTYVVQYSTVKFPCVVRGSPPPQIYTWFRKGRLDEPFNGLPARAYMDQDHSLVIPYIQTWDNGTYTCNVTNEYFEYTWSSARMVVVEPPSIVTPPHDYSVNEFGESSTFTCKCEPQAVAVEKCEVMWRRRGVKVVDQETSVSLVDYTSVLTISSTQDRHLGKYECYGYNRFGSASAYAYITKSNKPYMITKPPEKLTTSSKSSVSLECAAIGYPPLNYMWTFNSLPLQDTRVEVQDSGTLLIDGVVSADTGTFTCFASNPYGQTSVSTLLVVSGPPPTPSSPWIETILRDNNNQYSATIKIKTAEYKYVAISKYILTAMETEGGATTTIATSDNPYLWSNLEARAYSFSVVLQNNIEASEASEPSGTVDFRDYDDIPGTSVTGVEVSADNTVLSWDVLSGATSYKIYQWKVESQDSRSYLGVSNTNEYKIADISVLLPFTQYDFQIVPVGTGDKEGLYSEPLRVRTQPTTPLSPQITSFTNTDNRGEIIVEFDRRWQPSSGRPKEFQVYFKRKNTDYHSVSRRGLTRDKRQSGGSITALSAAVNVIVSDLVPGEEYTFSVTAENMQGMISERSTSQTRRTQTGKPEVPTVYFLEGSGRDAIEVRWNAPSITNGEILGYYVYYRLDNSFPDVAARVAVHALTTHYNVTGLDEGFRYEFAVSAFTSAGEGVKTAWGDMTPRSKSIPNKMDTPRVLIISWNTVNVSWRLEDDGLTGIDTFTIFLDGAINRGGQSSYVIPNRNDRHAQITSLDEDTIYALSIVATNHIGASSRSNPYEFRTYKKPLYLRAWFAGMVTGIVAFMLLVLFAFLFYFYVYKSRVPPVKEEKKAPVPYIGRDGGARPVDDKSLVLGNPVPLHEAERYSSRESREEALRMSDLRARQHSDNSYRRQYEDDSYNTDSYNKDYNKDQYKDNYKEYDTDRYHDNRAVPHYNDSAGCNQYDDDRFSSDNQRPAPRDTGDGFVIDNPAAARFSQI